MSDSLRDIISPELYENMDVCVEQIWYWRTDLDRFIMDYLHIKLFDTQQVMARAIGNNWDISIALNRGYGKTWLLSVCAVALAILWPGGHVAVVSNTAPQANLLLKYIDRSLLPSNEDIRREIDYGIGRGVRVKDNQSSIIYFKNGSYITSLVLGHKGASALGNRAKFLIIDEAKLVPSSVVNKSVKPIASFKRDVYFQLKEQGFVDCRSKIISISSAFFNTCDYAIRFKNTLKRMARGHQGSFACALNYESCARVGIESMEFYEQERETLSPVEFATEYGSVFVGAMDNSVFPYSVTEPCRVLNNIELSQPKGTTCKYVISLDIAGSFEGAAPDNSSICVLKIVEKNDGRWQKHVVNIATYRGINQRQLAEEIRKTYLRFPNTVMIIYDRNAIGVGMVSLFDEPWTYEDDKGIMREMPPLVAFDSVVKYKAENILYPFVATNQLNNALAQVLMKNLHDKDVRFPAVSTSIQRELAHPRLRDEDDDAKGTKEKQRRTMLVTEEIMVFKEADALQAEMGNIVCRFTAQGSPLYDVAISTQKKDRYTALAMGLWYIDQLETKARREGYGGKSQLIPVAVGNF